MANNPLPYDNTVITGVNAVTALLNSGTLKFYTGSQPALNAALTGTLLATLTFNSTAFAGATAAAGTVTATANPIASGTAVATGTAGYFALVTSGAATVLTGTVGTSASDINLNNTSITNGVTVSVSSFTITEPET